MSLNSHRDEAAAFLAGIGAEDENVAKILGWLDQESADLKDAVARDDRATIQHQVYDVMFLLFELAARLNLDLDGEWETGRRRKQENYLQNE